MVRPSRRRRRPEPRPLGSGLSGMQRSEEHEDGEWIVRHVTGSASARPYRCPGCQQEVRPGTPHVVAWPSQTLVGEALEERRHWHTACWGSRARRRPR